MTLVDEIMKVDFQAIPHRACAKDAKSYFLSGCSEIPQAYLMYDKEVMGKLTENMQADFVQALCVAVLSNQPFLVEKRPIFAL